MFNSKYHHDYSGIRIYKRLLKDLLKYWKIFIISILAMLISAATTPIFAMLIKPLIEEGFVKKDEYTLYFVPIFIVVLFIIRGIANFINEYTTTYLSSTLIQVLRCRMFNKILSMPINYYHNNPSGKIIAKFVNDVNLITDAGFNVITVLGKDGVTVIALIGVLLYRNWKLAIIIFIVLPIITLCIRYMGNKLRKLSSINQNYVGELTQVVSENINGVKEVRIYNTQTKEKQRFFKVVEPIRKNLSKQTAASALNTSINQLFVSIALAIIIFIAGKAASKENFTAGDFMSFLTAMIMMFDPIKRLTGILQSLQRGIAAADSVFSFLDEKEENDNGSIEVNDFKEKIEFKNVSFKYPNNNYLSLDNINLNITKGRIIALVGISGCGKTTLINLLPRFYEISSGSLLIDSIDIKNLTLFSLREQISLVSQEVVLFNDTIFNNVAYGQQNISYENVINSLKIANAYDFVEQMPDGVNTLIGDKGAKLSGGQRQRIAIARAIIKNAPILILDEATSALDNDSENQVQQALEKLMKGKTTIIVAHRLSTVEKADEIIVMDKGKIIEKGTHQELIKLQGQYKKLYNYQLTNKE